MAGRGLPGREPTPGPRVSPGSHGRAEGSPTAPPVPRSGLSRSPQPHLQVGKLRHGNGQRLFCQSTDLTSTGWPSGISHRQGHIPAGVAAGWRGGSDAGGGHQGEWGTVQPSLRTRWRAGHWWDRPDPALQRSTAAAPASAHLPAQAEPGWKLLNRPLKSFGAARWKIQRGNSSVCKPPRLARGLRNAKPLHQNAAPVHQR